MTFIIAPVGLLRFLWQLEGIDRQLQLLLVVVGKLLQKGLLSFVRVGQKLVQS